MPGLKPITPKVRINVRAVQSGISGALRKTCKTGETEFYKTTRTWDTPVVFFLVKISDSEWAVGTNNNIYSYVARGTRPHLITPVRSKALVFGEGTYKARTTPGVLGSRQVGTGLQGTGGVARPIFARKVHHPGTKARGFEGLVAKRLQRVLERNVTAAIMKAIG